MADYQYDVIFVGSGHANWHAAVTLRQAGKRVAVVEEDLVAGTCTNYGCNAKILLDGPAAVLNQVHAYQKEDIITGDLKINWPDLMKYKHHVIDPLHVHLAQMFKAAGIDLLKGHGHLADAHTVHVAGKEYSSEYLVLGTGQRPAKLNIPGKTYLHDSRDFLSLPELPAHITFIGAGIVSLEFADLARIAGAEVTVIEFAERPLRAYYDQYVDKVINVLKDAGIDFHFKEAVDSVQALEQGYLVRTASGLTVETDYVVDATGRVPNVEDLGLDEVGVSYNRRGIEVDNHLRTSQKNIFASGDVLDKQIPRLTPTATFESNYIAAQILGLDAGAINYPVVPSIVFTLPRLAETGVTVAEAEADAAQYRVERITYGRNMLFQTKNEPEAELTIIIDSKNKLVGAAIYGDDAPDLINILSLIINQHLSAEELSQMIFAFPSASIGVLSLIMAAMRK